jgi:hypothetical protein
MINLRLFSHEFESVPTATSWYLVDIPVLCGARGKRGNTLVKGFTLDDERFKEAGAEIISMNCSPASGTSVLRKRFSGARCSISTPRASTMTRTPICRGDFYRGIRCVGTQRWQNDLINTREVST